MTEIPEHLLRRSRERREALGLPTEGEAPGAGGGGGSDAGGGGTASPATPAPRPVPAARPPQTPAAPPPPKPMPPYVQAALRRPRIPFWAMPVLFLLPLWAFLYFEAMKPPHVKLTGPLAEGQTLYASKCSSCHGAGGEGGVGYELNNGEVLKSFATIQSQVSFVYSGNKPYVGLPYGTGRHIGGQRGAAGAMPAWGQTAGGELTDEQVVAVVCHERYTIGGGDQTSPEFQQWCAPNAPDFEKVKEGGLAAVNIPKGPGG